jgi:hypothetical protein
VSDVEARFFTTCLATDREPASCARCAAVIATCGCSDAQLRAWLEAQPKPVRLEQPRQHHDPDAARLLAAAREDKFLRELARYQAVKFLVALLRTVIPLAAAAQVGRCGCRRAIPWERACWASPQCYTCMEEDENDRKRRARLEELCHGHPSIAERGRLRW